MGLLLWRHNYVTRLLLNGLLKQIIRWQIFLQYWVSSLDFLSFSAEWRRGFFIEIYLKKYPIFQIKLWTDWPLSALQVPPFSHSHFSAQPKPNRPTTQPWLQFGPKCPGCNSYFLCNICFFTKTIKMTCLAEASATDWVALFIRPTLTSVGTSRPKSVGGTMLGGEGRSGIICGNQCW